MHELAWIACALVIAGAGALIEGYWRLAGREAEEELQPDHALLRALGASHRERAAEGAS